ncbi:MAG: transcription-repair coupling factor [Bacteroidaceae bacterium]|nr:transcription-repair coupling factor [Bacteroidaceae bacterium]
MTIDTLVLKYAKHPKTKSLCKMLSDESIMRMSLSGCAGSSAALAFAALPQVDPLSVAKPYVFVLNDAEEAGYFYHDCVQILGEEQVLFFPSSYRRAIKYGQKEPANEIMRTEVLSRLTSRQCPLYLVTYPEALCERTVSRKDFTHHSMSLARGEKHDPQTVEQQLLDLHFQRTDYVYEPGQFSIRGSLIDIYSYSEDYPFRIDFFSDEIDSIRSFDIHSQLSVKKLEKVTIVPEFAAEYEMLTDSFLSFLDKNAVLVIKNLPYLIDSVASTYETGFSSQALTEEHATKSTAESDDELQLRRKCVLISKETFQRQILDFRILELSSQSTTDVQAKVVYDCSPQPLCHKNFDIVCNLFTDFQQKGYKIYILADSPKQHERLRSIFQDLGAPIEFTPVEKTLHEGFCDATQKICCFTDHQIFDRFHKYNLRSEQTRIGKVALTLKELQQFELGDYVVHLDHGVGCFGGLVRIPENGQMIEKIKLIYQNEDFIFVSLHALHKVSKYKGKEGEPPRVNKLGTGAWERMKERTKSKIKDIARDLIQLYSVRQQQQGFRFSPDSYLQHELEASFLYEDTPDQSKATAEVKKDMERTKPMDRLVCGDVGFGKTEVAIRAAFKAACDGKQVALLVPTTVLAYQHFHTFSERLKDFPVRIEYLSRARSAQKTKEILAALKDGKIDILIGTHKIIGKSVTFKDIGLLIIDEEQKFGVSTKERLRQLRTNVDTLTLTATPIPRTLQFSLMGARDLSVIQTPPPNRYPIQTELHCFNAQVIADAINFEMSRNGQVFIVSNRISSLPELETLVHKYVPDARVCVGHGRMSSEELEHVILDFANYDYDVLISTTIIENGIDIPNANTIIINAAHHFGLSDLHQMRGRVGRSNKKAFCYLLSPPLSALTPEARRRLQAIENFSGLGSGIHLAMQDLDIRGAGNLLGSEQSGFIADLGYDTYQKILKEAINELHNDEFHEMFAEKQSQGDQLDGTSFVDECQIDSDICMHFSELYVPGSSERMLLYRELDNLSNADDVEQFRQRMHDRFGEIPSEGEELIRVVLLRQLGKYFGAERIVLKSGRMRLFFVQNPDSPFFQSHAFGQIIAFISVNVGRCRLEENNQRRTLLVNKVTTVKEAVDLLAHMQKVTPL